MELDVHLKHVFTCVEIHCSSYIINIIVGKQKCERKESSDLESDINGMYVTS